MFAPVISSIVSSEAILPILSDRYGLEENLSCRIFRTGINHTYEVSHTKGKYMFRLYTHQWRTEEEIYGELNFINRLQEKGISVSVPIQDIHQQYLQRVHAPEGMRFGVLFSYAEGSKKRVWTEMDCRNAGVLMAQCHAAGTGSDFNRRHYGISSLMDDPYQHLTVFFSESMEEMQFIRRSCRFVTDALQDKPLVQGMLHLDFWYDNMNITSSGAINLFDFDFCGYGWLVLDMAYFLKHLFHIVADADRFESMKSTFITGYTSVLPVSEVEKAFIPLAGLAISVFYLGVQCKRFDDWSNIFLTENYFRFYVGQVRSWLQYHNIAL